MTDRAYCPFTQHRHVGSAWAPKLALLAAFLLGPAAEASIIPISDEREIKHTEFMGPNDIVQQLTPNPDFSFFDVSLSGGDATQTSSITADGIFAIGSGRGNGPFVGTGYRGISVLDLTFEVDLALDYDLFGALGSSGDERGSYLQWFEDGALQFQLYGPDCPCSPEQFTPFSTTLSLSPGVTYRLRSGAANPLQTSGGGSFDITLQAVPEPGTGVLVMLGLGGFAALRRRK